MRKTSPIEDIQFRLVQGIAEVGNENQRLQYRVKTGGEWSKWLRPPIVEVDKIEE